MRSTPRRCVVVAMPLQLAQYTVWRLSLYESRMIARLTMAFDSPANSNGVYGPTLDIAESFGVTPVHHSGARPGAGTSFAKPSSNLNRSTVEWCTLRRSAAEYGRVLEVSTSTPGRSHQAGPACVHCQAAAGGLARHGTGVDESPEWAARQQHATRS
jgi:hypothetical protein